MGCISMNKMFYLMFVFAVVLLLTSCKTNNDNNSSEKNINSDVLSSMQTSLSEEDAVDLITKIIGNANGKRIIDINGSKTVDNVVYYVVHAYSLSIPLDEEGTQISYTYGWYYVNRLTGQAYEYDMTSEEFKLNPLN